MSKVKRTRVVELLDYDADLGVFTWRNPTSRRVHRGQPAGSLSTDGYIRIQIDRKLYLAHHLAWLVVTGSWPKGNLDHRDGVRTNNVFDNLREAGHGPNSWNAGPHIDNTSGVKGVHFHSGSEKWRAVLMHNGRQHHLGLFSSLEEARETRRKAALNLYGEFAVEHRLNPNPLT